jgi:hypothetical protein
MNRVGIPTLYRLLRVQDPGIWRPAQVGDPKRLQRYLHVGTSKNYRSIYMFEIPDITVYYIHRLEIPIS